MVGNQQVYKTPSANVAVAIANLDRLPDTPEYQGIQSNIRAHLIAMMGQTATLLKRVQAVSYMEVSSDQTHAAGLHHDPAGAIIAAPPTIAGRTLDATTVVRTRAVTVSRGADVVRK